VTRPAFYTLAMDQQTHALADLATEALRAWSPGEARVELVKYRENAVFCVTEAEGTRYALRIHRPGYRSDAQIRSEVDWMRALSQAGVRTPEVVPTTAGDVIAWASVPCVPEPRQCDLLRWVPGEPLGSLEGGAAGDDRTITARYRTLGELAARVHEHGIRWKRPEEFERPAFDAAALVGEEPAWGAFWKLDCLSSAQLEVLFEARERTREELAAFGNAPDRYGLIHGDFLPENVLISQGDPLLIDFDDCGDSWYAFELATGLFPMLQNGRPGMVTAAYLEGYRGLRSFPDDWLGRLPAFLMARTLSYLGWPAGRPENQDARRIAPLLADLATGLARRYLAGEPIGSEA
jgi:Ser/Thr protein kinase RdoA (MazF antagonist)